MGPRIEKVIGDEKPMTANEDSPVEIMQAKEAREEKSTPPEWIWNPRVKVVIIPRRWIICDDWRTFFIVIVVYFTRVGLGLIFSILTGAAGYNRQPEFSCDPLECFQSIILPHRQFSGVSCSDQRIL